MTLATPDAARSDVRWERWQARALRQDRRSIVWARAAMIAVFVALAAWLIVEVVGRPLR